MRVAEERMPKQIAQSKFERFVLRSAVELGYSNGLPKPSGHSDAGVAACFCTALNVMSFYVHAIHSGANSPTSAAALHPRLFKAPLPFARTFPDRKLCKDKAHINLQVYVHI